MTCEICGAFIYDEYEVLDVASEEVFICIEHSDEDKAEYLAELG